MSVSRRTTLRALGAAGATLAMSGSVLAVGEHDDDERDPVDEEEAEPEPVEAAGAAVRVAHFSPDAPNVDVYVDGNKVLADLAFDEVSEYLEIDPGTYTVTVTAAGDPDTVAFEGDVEVGPAFYTIAAIGELEAGTFEPLVLVDAGAALVRLVHASTDAPAVDVFPAGADDPLFANLAFGDATDYVPLPAGEYDLEVRPATDGSAEDDHPDGNGTDDEVEEQSMSGDESGDSGNDEDATDENGADGADDAVFTVTVDLAPATAYTGYAIGYLSPEGDQPEFDVNVTVDGPFSEDAPSDEPEEEPADEPEEEPADEPDADDADADTNATDDEPATDADATDADNDTGMNDGNETKSDAADDH